MDRNRSIKVIINHKITELSRIIINRTRNRSNNYLIIAYFTERIEFSIDYSYYFRFKSNINIVLKSLPGQVHSKVCPQGCLSSP